MLIAFVDQAVEKFNLGPSSANKYFFVGSKADAEGFKSWMSGSDRSLNGVKCSHKMI